MPAMRPSNPVLVQVLRGSTVESVHRGAIAVVDADGAVHTAVGEIAAKNRSDVNEAGVGTVDQV